MTPAATAIPAVDLISDQQDDLLQRILFYLPAAGEVARTSVLSRRWRHLWSNATALRFGVGRKPESYGEADGDAARRVIAAASATIARRAAAGGGPDVEDLELLFVYTSEDDVYLMDMVHHHGRDITPEQIATWLHFAACRVTGFFALALPIVPQQEEEDGDDEAQDEEEEYDDGEEEEGKEEEEKEEEEEEEEKHVAGEEEGEHEDDQEPMVEHIDNDNNVEEDRVLVLEMPCSARAEEMDLTLGNARLKVPVAGAAGAFAALTDMTLRYAQLDPASGDDLRLSDLLSSSCCPQLRSLCLNQILGLTTLRLDASDTLEDLRLGSLRDLETLDVAAPGLLFLSVWNCGAISEARIAAPRVEELHFVFVRHPKLLQFDGAASVRRVVSLQMWSHGLRRGGEGEGGAGDCNDNSATVWLLRNCTGVNRLRLEVNLPYWWSDFKGKECLDLSCICQSADWDNLNLSLEHLRNLEIYDFVLLDSQIRLLRLLLASAPALERMTVEFDMSEFKDGKDQVNFDIPCAGGRWLPSVWECSEQAFVRPVGYEWLKDAEREEGGGEA
ncbi:unnamed protein product [Urochloa decumbens]|uniref:F-box domain-containing protein n=1 Tax=Urochloa decumbens TaxID=240449 RepID=A0ABC9GGA1_9POAL